MDRLTDEAGDRVFDASPYLKIVIDKDGKWFQNGMEIVHPEVYRQFCAMLEKTADGGYRVRMGREICRVEVEDAPFVVQRVTETPEGELTVLLNDSTTEHLDPASVRIGADEIPYCTVKQGKFHARFSRPAYYQLAEHIVPDEGKEGFVLVVGDTRTPVRKRGND